MEGQSLDEDGKSRINAIREALYSSTRLIDRLLFVTHVSKDLCAPFELDPVVREAIKEFSDGPISIRAKLDTKGWLAVAEATLVRQAVSELIANGIEASSEIGSKPVFVETKVENESKSLAVEISDNGPGVPDEIAERIFNPFVTSRFLGRGLGLPLAKRAADACGGDLRWSRYDGTTKFILLLPRSAGVE